MREKSEAMAPTCIAVRIGTTITYDEKRETEKVSPKMPRKNGAAL
jgi:hypothetical protein